MPTGYELKYGEIAIFDVSPKNENPFARNVCEILGVELKAIDVDKFLDGETDLTFNDSVRGRDVYVFQFYVGAKGERKTELEYFCDAAKSGGAANRVTAVLPYVLGQRGERRTRARQPIPALVIANGLKANGADGIVGVGIHSEALGSIYSAVGLAFEKLEFEYLVANYIINNYETGVCIGSPDIGGSVRAHNLGEIVEQNSSLDTSLAIAYKRKPSKEQPEITEVIGNLEGKNVVTIDDISSTFGTITASAKAFRERGASKITAAVCHPVLVEGSINKLEEALSGGLLDLMVFGNTIPVPEQVIKHPKIKVIPLEPFVAEAIRRIHFDESISGLHKYPQIVEAYKKQKLLDLDGNFILVG